MISSARKGRPHLELVPSLPQPPVVDVERITVDSAGVHFGLIENAELIWYLDPRSGRKVSAVPVGLRGTTLPIEGLRPRGRHVLYVAGNGGWSEVTIEAGLKSVRPAPASVDGSGIGFSESAWFCREPSVIGYDQGMLTVRHPVGGAVRHVELVMDVARGTFDTSAYLGLAEGDRVKLELAGPSGGFTRDFVFPKPPDPWTIYSLDQLKKGTGYI